jgi:general secretion pathway protein G
MLERLHQKRTEGGFTLIELLIVIVILAILAAIVVFAVGTSTTNAVTASCRADVKSVETAVESYHAQTGAFPTATGNLTSSTSTGGSTVGPWLRAWPSSPSYTVALGVNGTVLVNLNGAAAANLDTTPAACG